jgi:hypothetical protein
MLRWSAEEREPGREGKSLGKLSQDGHQRTICVDDQSGSQAVRPSAKQRMTLGLAPHKWRRSHAQERRGHCLQERPAVHLSMP